MQALAPFFAEACQAESETKADPALLNPARLILFESPDQIRSRPLWRDDLEPSAHPPVRILGGYNFGRSNLWACGMSSCRTSHGAGYVVATKSGLETHIGHDCGKRLFSENFADLEQTFQRQFDAQTRRDLLEGLLHTKDEALKDTKKAIQQAESNQALVNSYVSEIDREPALQRAFQDALREGGRLVYSRKKTESELEITGRKEHFIRETVGRIDGVAATSFRKLDKELKYDVLGPLYDLTAESLATASQKHLEQSAKLIGELREKLRQAEEFSAATRRFIKISNWLAFQSLFGPGKTKTTDRGLKILRQLVAKSQFET